MTLPTSPYNLNNLTALNNTAQYLNFVNSVTGGWAVSGFVVVFFLIMTFALSYKTDFHRAVMVSSLICFLLSLFFRIAKLMSGWFIFIFLILLALAGLWEFTGGRR